MNKPVAPGDVLLGKYRVERVLGKGGMGIVVAARHVELDHLYAIKLLLPAIHGQQEWLERFLREARAAARLQSEHVARVHDVGNMENGAPYMVMEYLDGCDLKALLAKQGPLSVEDSVEYVLQACDAIGEAHELGIVHRDLKPANLFLVHRRNGSPCVKVIDFGISKLTGPGAAKLTGSNAMYGSPKYMSPEQIARTNAVDMRTDIWAMGVILYELLTARSPFHASNMAEVMARALTDEPTPLRELRPDVPPEIEAVVTRCLRKRREDRFDSVQELVGALCQAMRSPTVVRPTMASGTLVLSAAKVSSTLPAPAVKPESPVTTLPLPVPTRPWSPLSTLPLPMPAKPENPRPMSPLAVPAKLESPHSTPLPAPKSENLRPTSPLVAPRQRKALQMTLPFPRPAKPKPLHLALPSPARAKNVPGKKSRTTRKLALAWLAVGGGIAGALGLWLCLRGSLALTPASVLLQEHENTKSMIVLPDPAPVSSLVLEEPKAANTASVIVLPDPAPVSSLVEEPKAVHVPISTKENTERPSKAQTTAAKLEPAIAKPQLPRPSTVTDTTPTAPSAPAADGSPDRMFR
ncbi:serine/threonine protein kinase [Polyangium sp. y55x31]|uniref:serine/threonine protein kinase n=1 Tax=Polyangium sp. y55x31 TaxID=3042688 RepID=UPI002482740B|nr:serine/threonine protein kinase [Polyangium sp. y55x31]MDI1476423.1 protein kinase [Polyangium sp. y55x31]